MRPLRRLLVFLCSGLVMVVVHAAEETSALTLESLFRPGGVTQIAIAPGGRHLAYTGEVGGNSLKLLIIDLEETSPPVVLSLEDKEVQRFNASKLQPTTDKTMSSLGAGPPRSRSLNRFDRPNRSIT